jgi:hypothetical protein
MWMRMDKVRRFADVQRQLQRAAEWELNDLRQEQHRLQQAQQELVTALNRDDPLSRWLAPSLSRKLTRLAADTEEAAAAGRRQVDVVLQHAGRLKHAERVERSLEREEQRTREKNALSDTLDVIIGGPRAIVR